MCSSRCGKDCASCEKKEEFGCGGCLEITDGYWGGKCEIKECCEAKTFEHCGMCGDFPCGLIREFSYDPETGDDGEMLLSCKEWADGGKAVRENRLKNFLLGTSIGIIAGVIFGEWQGAVIPFVIGGIIVGSGIALMVEINKRK